VALVNPHLEPGMKRYHVPSDPRSALFGSDITDHWYPVHVGGDVAFIYGVLKVLFENGWHDAGFVRDHVAGLSDLQSAAAGMEWDRLEHDSGVPRSTMADFAWLLRDSPRAVFVWSMGITQHAFGADAVRMILNLGIVRGYVGREMTGLMPIRGHSGVQGGAEMGAYATAFPGGMPINPANATALSRQYGFNVPATPGLSAAEMVEAAHAGELDVLYCVGGNFLRTLPEPNYVIEAMSRLPLRVHQDIILTDQMFIDGPGDVLLLPAKTRYEQDGGGTQTTTERRVCFSPEIPRQVGEARAEWQILRDIAVAARPGMADRFGCRSGQEIRNEIAAVIPSYRGIERLRQTGDAFQWGGRRLCDGGRFNTPDGKAHLRPVALPFRRRREPDSFRCTTRRGKQFNTLIYAEIDPLTGAPRDAIFMNPDDAARLHLRDGQAIALVNDVGQFHGRVHLAPVTRGNLQIHWPEGNVIIARGRRDEVGGVPDYNCEVRVELIRSSAETRSRPAAT
jgi:molybdopterin-dependent oxidoreductase alpha subunit